MTPEELLQTVAAVGASGGGIAATVALVIRMLAPHIVRMREAKIALLQEQAKADTARADAVRAESHARRTGAEDDAARTAIVAGALEQMRVMREEHTSELVEVRAEIRECQQRHSYAREALHAMRMWSQSVVYEMRRRGMTPPEMPAAVMELEDV